MLTTEDGTAPKAAETPAAQLSRMNGSGKGECKSHNWIKQNDKINRIHAKVRHARADFLHKLSAALTDEYDVIATETFSIREMYDHGNCKKKRSNINRAYANDGWYEFTRQLEYKSLWKGRHFVKVDKDYPSTQICSHCGHVQTIDLNEKTYRCGCCGSVIDRNHNAALNVKSEGLRLLAV